ncbi:hypothetical protein P6F26_02610 [Roseibacterium sp. SDUM158017]|uniref:hypothetical protein n=1 Tax=Roseicyclus salinarum TaxID=3036773 RepID=UPI0024156D66|nr:hypothetical protein [Roseibacterium sp. SDUM158017]MDG4647322.1 hypothetical protein [Roseibacterium sp. SDUM158017]
MEMILATLVFVLAAGGLGLGLALGRGPVRGSCGGASCMAGDACAACPRKRQADAERDP